MTTSRLKREWAYLRKETVYSILTNRERVFLTMKDSVHYHHHQARRARRPLMLFSDHLTLADRSPKS